MSDANVNRWVFSLFLKSVMSETVRKLAGREFHAMGPEKEKACSPNLVYRRGVTLLAVSERQRRPRRVILVAEGCMMSDM